MNVKETQYQLDEIMKINNAKFLTSNQFNWLRSNITNKIERISKERETLIQNQSVPFNERILKLQAMDKEMESQKESLKFLENQKVRFLYSDIDKTFRIFSEKITI
jgi:enoyl reductase-like protein